jgi:hypothetical protein
MKKRFKKIMACTLCASLFAFGGIFAACKDSTDNEPEDDEVIENVEYSLNYHIYTLSLYDSVDLNVDGLENVVFSSSAPTVATVDENGVVTALACGQAIITASVEGVFSDTCIINVPDDGNVPSLLINAVDGALALIKGDTYLLQPSISFMAQAYDDGTFTYEVADKTVADVTAEGLLTAKAVGETTITVKGTWRTFGDSYLSETIILKVNPDLSITVNASATELDTVSETIDGKTYNNTANVSYTIEWEGQDVTATADTQWLLSDDSILEINNGTITAKKLGTTEMVLQYVRDGKTYVSRPLIITVAAPTVNVGYVFHDVDALTDLTFNDIQGDVLSVYTQDNDFTQDAVLDADEQTVVLNEEPFRQARGEKQFIIETSVYTYQVDVVFATHLISTKDEFQAYLSSYDNASPSDTQIAEEQTWYAVLTNDIVLTEQWTWQRTQKSWLRGTFDGLGYMVKGPVCAYGIYGLFGGVSAGATVKNIAFENLFGQDKSTSHNVLSGYMAGTLENVYVKGTTAKAPQYVRLMNGTIKNCIFDVRFVGETVGVAVWNLWGKIENVFSIGTVGEDDITENYAMGSAFLAEQAEHITAKNEWSKYWSFGDLGLYFGDELVVKYIEDPKPEYDEEETKPMVYPASYTYTNCAYSKEAIFTVDVSTLIGNAEEYTVWLDDREIITDGVLTLNVADYMTGMKHEVLVIIDNKAYIQPFMLVSHAISTKDQFQTYLSSYDNASPSDAQIAEEQTWYAVLTNDIVLTEEWKWQRTSNSWLRGTFDGLGYMVKGPVLGYGVYGLFGGVATGATVKNVGFDNLFGMDASTTHNVLSGYMAGTMENVYVKGATAKSPQYVRLMNGTIKNCIFNVSFTGTAGTTVWNNWGTKTNLFSIGTVASDDITVNYATAAEFISAQLANITSANGWNMDVWSVKDNSLYFGDTKVS